MLVIHKVREFNWTWVSNAEVVHLLHRIQKDCWIVIAVVTPIVKANLKLKMKLNLPPTLGDKKNLGLVQCQCRVDRPVTEHIVFQSPQSHSKCLLSGCGLKIKCSPLESALIVIWIDQNWSKMRKIHFFKVLRGKSWFLKMDHTCGSPSYA